MVQNSDANQWGRCSFILTYFTSVLEPDTEFPRADFGPRRNGFVVSTLFLAPDSRLSFPNSRLSFPNSRWFADRCLSRLPIPHPPYRNLDTTDSTKVKICQTQIRSRLLIIWIEHWTTHWDSVGQVGCVDLAVCGLGYGRRRPSTVACLRFVQKRGQYKALLLCLTIRTSA